MDVWTNSYTLGQTGESLRDVRRGRGKRQDAFARGPGASHATPSNLERGKNTPTKTLERALQRLGLRYAGIAAAEAWAMNVAAHAARCAKTALLDLEGAPPSLVVERYGRMWRGGVCERIHQEDCCQALGIDPSGKYAGHDMVRGPTPHTRGLPTSYAYTQQTPSGNARSSCGRS